jgi:hypothetical protein
MNLCRTRSLAVGIAIVVLPLTWRISTDTAPYRFLKGHHLFISTRAWGGVRDYYRLRVDFEELNASVDAELRKHGYMLDRTPRIAFADGGGCVIYRKEGSRDFIMLRPNVIYRWSLSVHDVMTTRYAPGWITVIVHEQRDLTAFERLGMWLRG